MEDCRLEEAEWLVQGHIISKQWIWNLNPGRLAPNPIAQPLCSNCLLVIKHLKRPFTLEVFSQVSFLLVNTRLHQMESPRPQASLARAHCWYLRLSMGSESRQEPISNHSPDTPAYNANEEIFLSRNKLQETAEVPSSCFSLHVLDATGRLSRNPRLWPQAAALLWVLPWTTSRPSWLRSECCSPAISQARCRPF